MTNIFFSFTNLHAGWNMSSRNKTGLRSTSWYLRDWKSKMIDRSFLKSEQWPVDYYPISFEKTGFLIGRHWWQHTASCLKANGNFQSSFIHFYPDSRWEFGQYIIDLTIFSSYERKQRRHFPVSKIIQFCLWLFKVKLVLVNLFGFLLPLLTATAMNGCLSFHRPHTSQPFLEMCHAQGVFSNIVRFQNTLNS